jgi:hypothetical protein
MGDGHKDGIAPIFSAPTASPALPIETSRRSRVRVFGVSSS